MKYIIKKLNEDFIADELEQTRKQFVESLTNTIENAHILFASHRKDPLDIFIEYDFLQKNGATVIHGFNLREELVRNFTLDTDKYHQSKQLLKIGKSLRELADEINQRYDPNPEKTRAKIEDQQATEFAKNINRPYSEILKDAIAQDEALKKQSALAEAEKKANQPPEVIEAEYLHRDDAD